MGSFKVTEALSYDDILLVPSYSDVVPGDICVKSRLTKNISLNIPIISAAMDTVTDSTLAIAVALEGGAGVIHRNYTPEAQAQEVAKVKRYLNWIIQDPQTVTEDTDIGTIKNLMYKYNATGIPVVNRNKKLTGIITSRDLRFCDNNDILVKEVMTKKPIAEIGAPTAKSAREKFDKYKIEKLPIVDENGHVIGLVTYKDMDKKKRYPESVLDARGRLIVGAAISPVDYERRIPLLLAKKVDFVVMDTATGDTKSVIDAIYNIKKKYNIAVVGGNVATADGTKRLVDAGADCIKIGIGPGSICTTRIVAGIGVPQFTAVYDCVCEAEKQGIPTIADGGIKYSGDIVKAIGGGADTVMIGNLFAGLKEAPGKEVIYEGRIFKEYRGMGSIGAIIDGSGDRYRMGEDEEPVPEGIEGRVPYKGELKPFLYQLVVGLKKGMAYCGCKDLEALRNYKRFVKITAAGLKESHVHDVSITKEPPNYTK
ncbi:MAG: IMP dehydrogenase [Spirochaetaceae bacterium]|nr:IMP dehydrogenase [Spirochaetaceae bacterium]